MATSGPGATNLVTGIATAYMDSSPIVAITGNVPVSLLGKDSFQEVDIAGITMPITKHSCIVKDVNHLADTLRGAFHLAAEGRPGPVLVDIPKDITERTADYEYRQPQTVERRVRSISGADIRAAAELINHSSRPLIYAGGGVIAAGASGELRQIAELLGAPVALSAMGMGAFPGLDPKCTGLMGMHGTTAANMAVSQCDVLIACGVRFSDRAVGSSGVFAPQAHILHMDVDAAEINKNIQSECHVIGDIKAILERLLPMLQPARHKEWLRQVAEWKREYPLAYNVEGKLKPQYVIERVGAVNADKLIVTEVGQHQMWACQYIEYGEPRRFISSGGLGAMGFGLGAAIGAAFGCPGRTVFNIAGDGCFRMNCAELATAVEYNLPIVEVILNNHALGMVRQWQGMFYGGRYAQTDIDSRVDYCKLAEAFGAAAFCVDKPEDVDRTLARAVALHAPAVINCEIGKDDMVLPMVPPGAEIGRQISS
jgi:acetolactate synthase-1/2/3 large subunit